ncbi:PAS domain S-box protein [Methanosarcina sp. KYL-1]|uniref:PAS domain S-box protein n=1 Tax=Methanosarcina sp. KYL-1 TaxID=2602068 RepID=UPI0021009C85|nr:PAS domain S-box protein [Methanosarcina sp. KYL-1]MCQ1535925.1 PAS domain S-box protein [Methanosarcina sp. KYL-1]
MDEIRDITEKGGAEEELIAAQEELQLQEKLKLLSWAAESSNIALITTDFAGNLKSVNPVVLKMWGYEAEELLGCPASLFWDSPSEVLQAGKECRARGEWVGELVARRKDGTLFDAHASLNLLKDGDGKAVGLVGSCFDITERKQVEEELKKRTDELLVAKERLDLALEATGMGTWDWDVASNSMTWDENLFRLVGVSREEFLQTRESLLELSNKIMPHEDNKKMQEAVQEVLEGKTDEYKLEHGIIRPDGTIRYFSVKGRAYRNSKGELLRVIGTTQDITERRAAEEALRESESDLSRAQKIAHLGNYSWNIRTGEVSWSEELKSVWGCRPDEELSFEEVLLRVHPEDRARVREAGRLVREENYSFNVEYRIILPDGTVRCVHDQGEITRNEAGKPVRMFGTTLDITERKQMEEQLLRAKEAAETANKAKGEFLANMSHEIRTPMNAVMGMLELLLDTDLNEEQREYLKLAHVSAESLLSVIDDILEFSRIEQGKMVLENIDFDLRSSISHILGILAGRANSRGIKLLGYLKAGVPDAVIGDPIRLKQVLFNLIGNAIKFTEKGEVVLSVEPFEAGGPIDDEELILLFKVRDTGTGIPPKSLEQIFDSFTQADASVTRKYGGTGLGLSISSRLVELMGGRIWVESEVGKGSTFYFTVRVNKGKRSGSPGSPEERRAAGKDSYPGKGDGIEIKGVKENEVGYGKKIPTVKGLDILLAEDHPINQKLVVGLLEKRGHKVTIACNGEEVLDLLSKKDFDAVLMDVQMPGMDGIEATRRIRDPASDVMRHDIPVIALTARAMQEDRVKCMDAGMNDYIPKPLRKEELFKALEFLERGKCKKGKTISSPFEVSSSEVFDMENGLLRTEGDEPLLKEMIRIFLDTSSELLCSISKAVEEGNPEELGKAAHTLKSAAGSICTNRVFKSAQELEKIGRENKMEEASEKLDELKSRLEELEPVLLKFLSVQVSGKEEPL